MEKKKITAEKFRKKFIKSFDPPCQRPSFIEYFLIIASDLSLRSDDPDIRHGAVITTMDNNIIGTGYNGTIKKSNLDKVPLKIRDKKRKYMIHAEENAILNCVINPKIIGGAKIFVTGLPCVNCLQRIINFNIKEVYYADKIGSITEDEETNFMRNNILEMNSIKIFKIKTNTHWLKKNYV
jgi:deoxycytidylate deaminase